MSEAEKLEPCPFCGGEAEVSPHCGAFYVSCRSCAATSPVCTRAEAIAAWNNRARTPATDMREAAARKADFSAAYFRQTAVSNGVPAKAAKTAANACEDLAAAIRALPIPAPEDRSLGERQG